MLKNVNLAHTDMSSKFPSVPCVQCSCRNMVGVMFSDLTVKKLFFYILRLDDFALTAKQVWLSNFLSASPQLYFIF